MKVLLVAVGTTGDIYPFLALGKSLRDAGHAVTLATNEYFAAHAHRESLGFVPVGTADLYRETLKQYSYAGRGLWNLVNLRRSLQPLLPLVVERVYETIAENFERGNTVVGLNNPCFGAWVAREHLGVPAVRVRVQALGTGNRKSAAWWGRDALFRGVLWSGLQYAGIDGWVQRFRTRLGLPTNRRFLVDYFTETSTPRIALHPRWFLPAEVEIPESTVCCGFPLYDGDGGGLPSELEAFLTAGPPPVAFTTASWVGGDCNQFFETSLQACRSVGRRAVLLPPQGQSLSIAPADDWCVNSSVPYRRLLPRVAAFIHHGGLGTVAQALAAGIPQLVTPLSSDQPFNARQVERLGAGVSLKPAGYTVARVSRELERLLGSSQTASNCAALAEQVFASRDMNAAVRAFESALAPG